MAWPGALSALSGGAIVAIAGKPLRHALDRATSKAAMHLGRAWANANRLVLGQGKVDDQSTDITAIPKLFAMLAWAGAPVTIDAMGCQKAIAQGIPDQGADDVWALKKNHATLYDHVPRFLDEAQATAFADPPHADHETVDGDHGRIDTRRSWITSARAW